MVDLPSPGLAFFLPVDADHLGDIAFNVGFEMGDAAGDLAFGEVPVAVVHGFELAAVDGHAIALQRADPAAKLDELRADLADACTVVVPEVSDGLVIRHQLAGQPHDFDIAARLALQPAARWDAVQVAIDEQLEQHRRTIAGPPRPRGG